ncbi:protein usg [Novosphingobium umbonatum]|uniref:Protein usg n=1 Tax=Novosphingobium umbonatum TaxID=1908524 RepID=A0A437MWY5_9SPHN|nr:protein usg [Novosphingobium umbonatum]RVU02168.1 protein usg [Novosphingobium umbonatum]
MDRHGEIALQLQGYGLSTAEVSYFMPDYPSLLQVFVWQFYDEAPQFPELKRFLDMWRREIEAVVHSVRVMHDRLLGPRVWHPKGGIITLQ